MRRRKFIEYPEISGGTMAAASLLSISNITRAEGINHLLISYALNKNIIPRAVREKKERLAEFQNLFRSQGIETHWSY